MNDNVHLLRSVLAWGGVDDLIGHNLHERAEAALSELEAEIQRPRDALDRLASALAPLDVTIDHSLYVGSEEQMAADLRYIRQLLVDARRDIGETLA